MRTIEPTFNPGDEAVLQEWYGDKYPPGTKVKVIKKDHDGVPYFLGFPDGVTDWATPNRLHPRFKVGDRVKVVAKRPREAPGSNVTWIPEMDKFLGKEVTVTQERKLLNGVWVYKTDGTQQWNFLADWLKIVKEAEEPETKPAAPKKPSHSFKVGDKVKVIDTPPSDGDIAGRASWCPQKNGTCGRIGTITDIDSDGDIRVAFEDDCYWYRPEWLRPVEEKFTLSRAIKEITSLVTSGFKGKEEAPQQPVPLIRKNKFLTHIKLD